MDDNTAFGENRSSMNNDPYQSLTSMYMIGLECKKTNKQKHLNLTSRTKVDYKIIHPLEVE